jgi:hypothetical protein
MFPIEVWHVILNILGENGELRVHTNLCKVLKINPNLGSKYRKRFLIQSREYLKQDYDKMMIDFWEQTGIDDGVPENYLKEKLNKDTKMYRTIWACDNLYNKYTDKFILERNPAVNYIGHNYILHLTNKIYIDNRTIEDGHSINRWIDNFECIMEPRYLQNFKVYRSANS